MLKSGATTQNKMTLMIMTLSIITLNITILGIITIIIMPQQTVMLCYTAGVIMISAIVLSIIMLSVIMHIVIMPSFVKLSGCCIQCCYAA